MRTDMDFGEAIALAKAGKRVARSGWNGKNMAVAYRSGYPYGVPCDRGTASTWGLERGDRIVIRPYLQMQCADGTFQMWLASQTDILATDWQEVEA